MLAVARLARKATGMSGRRSRWQPLSRALDSESAGRATLPLGVNDVAGEDWWAVWIGLGIVSLTIGLFIAGSSVQWLAVFPQRWVSLQDLFEQFAREAERYFALLIFWVCVFSIGARWLGFRLYDFLPSFLAVLTVSALLCFGGQWAPLSDYALEPPLLGLGLGFLVANALPLPAWFDAGLRVELYIKTGIVLLGAELPVSELEWAAPEVLLRTLLAAAAGFGVIYLLASKLGLGRQAAGMLAAVGAICSASGLVAAAAAVERRRDSTHFYLGVMALWAVAIVLLQAALPHGSMVADVRAWIGASQAFHVPEDGSAVFGRFNGAPQVHEATADTVLAHLQSEGCDTWVGLLMLSLASIGSAYWAPHAGAPSGRPALPWGGLPKFVAGFVVASLATSVALHNYTSSIGGGSILSLLFEPLRALRVWVLTFAFFSIGLKLRIRSVSEAGIRSSCAFVLGALVILLSSLLAAHLVTTVRLASNG